MGRKFNPRETNADFLLRLDCPPGYIAFIYSAEEHEYEEGFGPSVTVRVGSDETTWKRSRNKWNPFEKIRTVANLEHANDFKVTWDRPHNQAYYVTERMYYYLDKEKYREKFKSLRAKLYITRVQQRSAQTFLLQFIIERQSDDIVEPIKPREQPRATFPVPTAVRTSFSPQQSPRSTAFSSPNFNSSSAQNNDNHSPRTLAMFNALAKTHLSSSPTSSPPTLFNQSFAQTQSPVHPTLVDAFNGVRDGPRTQSYPPMFAPATRFYPPMVGPSNPTQLPMGLAQPLNQSQGLSNPTTNLYLRSLAMASEEQTANQLSQQMQLAHQAQLQQLLAQQAAANLQFQRDQMLLQQIRDQQMYAAAGLSPLTQLYAHQSELAAPPSAHQKSRSMDAVLTPGWRTENKRQHEPAPDLVESQAKRRSTEMSDDSAQHVYGPGLNLSGILRAEGSAPGSPFASPSTASSTSHTSMDSS